MENAKKRFGGMLTAFDVVTYVLPWVLPYYLLLALIWSGAQK